MRFLKTVEIMETVETVETEKTVEAVETVEAYILKASDVARLALLAKKYWRKIWKFEMA